MAKPPSLTPKPWTGGPRGIWPRRSGEPGKRTMRKSSPRQDDTLQERLFPDNVVTASGAVKRTASEGRLIF